MGAHWIQAAAVVLLLGCTAKGDAEKPLSIDGVEPSVGNPQGGTYVRIRGQRFIADGARNAKVYFGSRQGTVVRFASDTELLVEAPGGTKENEMVDVIVQFEPGGEFVLKSGFKFSSAPPQEEVVIPRSMAGDKGTYYLLEMKRKGDVVSALHKRVGVDSVGWTRTETNCKTMRMRELGYSEESAEAIKRNVTKWFELVEGSSKSDLANFVCSR